MVPTISVEVVPPAGPDPWPLLDALEALVDLPIGAFNVASNPVAKPRMSALALCALIQQRTGKKAILHCTTRDHNRLSLQSLLWGARALGIDAVLIATGDFIALGDQANTSAVRDVDVYQLVDLARNAGLETGVVFDPHPEADGFERAVRRLRRKVEAGAQFVISQPLYTPQKAHRLAEATQDIDAPILLGILPLRTHRHAEFLHHRVAGIDVPERVRDRMAQADDPIAEGAANAREMLSLARDHFAGACLMPPFNHYEIIHDILSSTSRRKQR